MSSRLRNLNSAKISFFAFQDIITSVSGILILVVLMLSTELDKPVGSQPEQADPELQKQLDSALAFQAEIDAQNRRLQEVLAVVETAPVQEKLESDIATLRAQVSEQEQKHAALTSQLAQVQLNTDKRDQTLGLTALKTTINKSVKEADSLAQQEVQVRREMLGLEQKVQVAQSRLLNLKAKEGQLWLIPDKTSTTKEPVLVTVAATGAIAERFDQAEKKREINQAEATASFRAYLESLTPLNQYVVFLIRPSGISLFKELVEVARSKGFEVGYDALVETQQVHFSAPPAVEEAESPVTAAVEPASTNGNTSARASAGSKPAGTAPTSVVASPATNNPSAQTPATVPVTRKKSWWQVILEWIGIR